MNVSDEPADSIHRADNFIATHPIFVEGNLFMIPMLSPSVCHCGSSFHVFLYPVLLLLSVGQ